MKKSRKNSNATSFHDITFETSVADLRRIIGTPDEENNTGEEKTNFEWVCETSKGEVFTVYDYKEYRTLNENEIIEFHIGAFTKEVAKQAKIELFAKDFNQTIKEE